MSQLLQTVSHMKLILHRTCCETPPEGSERGLVHEEDDFQDKIYPEMVVRQTLLELQTKNRQSVLVAGCLGVVSHQDGLCFLTIYTSRFILSISNLEELATTADNGG